MRHFVIFFSLLVLMADLPAAGLHSTPYTVVARVTSFEPVRMVRGAERFSLATPQGSDATLMATVILPEELAGRDIAIPYESRHGGKERLVQKGTVFRFEHTANLKDLSDKTDKVRRRVIDFPAKGILVFDAETGKVLEAYEGSLTKAK